MASAAPHCLNPHEVLAMSSLYSVIRGIIFITATVAVVIFFLANRQHVTMSLFPLPFQFTLPLFVAPAVVGGIALLLGYMLGAIPLLSSRRSLSKEAEQLKDKLTSLQDENAVLRSQLLGKSSTQSVIAYHEQAQSRVLRPASELFFSSSREE